MTFSNLVDVARYRAAEQDQKTAYTFLTDGAGQEQVARVAHLEVEALPDDGSRHFKRQVYRKALEELEPLLEPMRGTGLAECVEHR